MGDLDKLIAAKGFKKLPKVQKIAQSGRTVPYPCSPHPSISLEYSAVRTFCTWSDFDRKKCPIYLFGIVIKSLFYLETWNKMMIGWNLFKEVGGNRQTEKEKEKERLNVSWLQCKGSRAMVKQKQNCFSKFGQFKWNRSLPIFTFCVLLLIFVGRCCVANALDIFVTDQMRCKYNNNMLWLL